jgi:RNA polymerase sigma-70 factor (ECF subfamily)
MGMETTPSSISRPRVAGRERPSSGEGREEFESLAFEHLEALYGFAFRMTRNAADAEDLVQETYLRAYRFFGRFRPGSSFRAWTFQIMRNRFITQYRRSRRRPAMVALDVVANRIEGTDAEHPTTGAAVPARTRHEGALSRRLEQALEQLPEDSRTALVLAYVEGFRYREIAQIMNWPIGTVMSRLHRCRLRLRGLIEDRPEPSCVRDESIRSDSAVPTCHGTAAPGNGFATRAL